MRKWIRQLALSLGIAVCVPAVAVEIEVVNETDLDVGVKVSGAETALAGAASKWISGADRATVTKPGGDALEYRVEETLSHVAACNVEVVPWGYYTKLFEKVRSTGAERVVGEICATREAHYTATKARLRFFIDGNGDYGLIFENLGTMKQPDRVTSVSAVLPAVGRSIGIASGLLRNGDYVLQYRDQCLTNGEGGHSAVPERSNWGGTGLCGFGAEAVYNNKQAVFTLRKLDAQRYVLLSAMWTFRDRASIGGIYTAYEFTGQSCLQANADGTVERTDAGTSGMCNGLSDEEFKRRPELLWKIKTVNGRTFITSEAHGGVEKCLAFLNWGQNRFPRLGNWGGGEVCGLSRDDFIRNDEGVWKPLRFY